MLYYLNKFLKKNTYLKNRKYLYRLIIVITMLLVVPTLLFLTVFWRRSFIDMERSQEAYYEKLADTYAGLFDDKIEELANHAYALSADSKKEPENILYEGLDAMENQSEIYSVTQELKDEDALLGIEDWAIYFYEMDKFVACGYAATVEQFANKHKFREMYEEFEEAIIGERFGSMEVKFWTSNTADNYAGSLLVGVKVNIGRVGTEAVVVYVLTPDDIMTEMPYIGNQGMACYVSDEKCDRIMLTWGEEPAKYVDNVRSGSITRRISGMEQKVLFQQDSHYPDLQLLIYVAEDSLQSVMMQYASDIKNMLLIITAALVLVCMAALYMAYKPIHELTHDMDSLEGGEIEMIRSVMDSRSLRIQEQEMLIMDLLINHLLYGVPISADKLKTMGIDPEREHHYLVMMLDGYVLASNEADKLTEEMKARYQVHFFVTDWQGENVTVQTPPKKMC